MERSESLFDDFGGYYAAYIDGTEVSRHAPSNFWTDYSRDMQKYYESSFTYMFITN